VKAVSGQGARSDLMAVKSMLDAKVSIRDVADAHFAEYVRYGKMFAQYAAMRSEPRTTMPIVILLIGAPRTGKTRTANAIAAALGTVYYVPAPKGSGLYFDNYFQEDSILIDEMNGNVMTPTFFNRLCDRYPMSVPVHGSGNVNFTSKYIFVTSNYLPHQWWKNASYGALMGRVSILLKFFNKSPPRATLRGRDFCEATSNNWPISMSKRVRPNE